MASHPTPVRREPRHPSGRIMLSRYDLVLLQGLMDRPGGRAASSADLMQAAWPYVVRFGGSRWSLKVASAAIHQRWVRRWRVGRFRAAQLTRRGRAILAGRVPALIWGVGPLLRGNDAHFVYGIVPENTVAFIPPGEAEELAAINRALWESKTWGEFRARIPPDALRAVRELLEAEEERMPEPDDAPFDSAMIPGANSGDWPDFPLRRMLDWIPARIQREFGTVERTSLNSPILELDASRLPQLVGAMQGAGYRCRRDDRLVRAACGG